MKLALAILALLALPAFADYSDCDGCGATDPEISDRDPEVSDRDCEDCDPAVTPPEPQPAPAVDNGRARDAYGNELDGRTGQTRDGSFNGR